ncbi:putative xylitol dehydrogenase [Naematelia encephala]|uniref:Putative xylitol dehydrogenase n=1 Tax=Naematelia encephala TaxID=71784 RepID=A0A1Y2APC2_9TREE|nr:putative xylitol dehydrogenase [Naematelia encephala]
MSSFHFLNKVQPPQVTALNLPPNTSCVLLKKRTISVEATPLPILQPDGVLVKVIATGICGSDLHNYVAGGVGGRPVTEPIVMGHESSGEVIAIGDLVTTHKVGDRVAVEPGLPCRRCINCKTGRSNICIDQRYCGSPGSVGSLSRFYALPADMAPHIPEHISWEESGSIQPLAIGVQIGKRVDLRAHQTLAIMGCGPIGLITAAVAHAYSARKIIAFDINPSRVEFARKYISPITGRPIIDHVFLVDAIPSTPIHAPAANGHSHGLVEKVSEAPSAAGLADGQGGSAAAVEDDHEDVPVGDRKWEWAKIRAAKYIEEAGLTAEEGVDRVVEASGAEDSGLLGIAIAKQGGIYLAVGLSHNQTNSFPTLAVTNKELDVRGITRYTASCFPSAIDMLSRGVVDLKQLITKVLPLSKSTEAFEAVASGREIKVIVKNQET